MRVNPREEINNIGRGDSFANSLSLLLEMNKIDYYVIVEVGTTRGGYGGGPKGDGWATLAWAWFTNKYGGEVHTIDIDDNCLDQCKAITKNYSNIMYHNCTGEEFLKSFKSKINLLYLDGSDDVNEMVDEYESCKELLLNSSLILLDDIPIDYETSGKGQLIIPILLNDGWNIEYHDVTPGVCQMLFSRRNND
jgi:hypothetical protein